MRVSAASAENPAHPESMSQTSSPPSPGPPAGEGDLSVVARMELARQWAIAVGSRAYVPMSGPDLAGFLLDLVDRLHDALAARPFTAHAGTDVGARMVAGQLIGEETLERSMWVLIDGLLGVGQSRDGERARRLVALLGAMSSGYAAALRRRTLEQQEDMKRALLSAKRRAELGMRALERRFREVFTSSATGIAITDLDGRFVEVNPALAKILACEADELAGRSLVEFIASDDVVDTSTVAGRSEDGQFDDAAFDEFRGRKRLLRTNGETAWVYLMTSLLRDGAGNPEFQVTMVQDLSELELLQGRLGHQLLHDALTGLANRQYFSTTVETAVEQAAADASITLCCLNLDGFSVINNALGHHVGDRLLHTVAQRLESAVADEKAVVARVGGDEFAILVQDAPGTPDVPGLVERINTALAEPAYIDGHGVAVGASVGAIRCPASGMSGAELFRAADVALRGARATGKRHWMQFDRHDNERTRVADRMAAALPEAWENGEIELRYQPVFRLADRRVVAVRPTLHWMRKADEPPAHDEIVELAERTGISVLFGPWLLQTSCQQLPVLRALLAAEPDAVLRVGLSRLQSGDADLVAAVNRALEGLGVPPAALEIGFDTGAVLDEFGSAPDNLDVVADLGVRTALCGFNGGPREVDLLARSPATSVVLADPFGGREWAPAMGSPVHHAIELLMTAVTTIGAVASIGGLRTEDEARWWAGIGVKTAHGPLLGEPTHLEEIIEAR